jgi:Acetyltransferase (GNAT) family
MFYIHFNDPEFVKDVTSISGLKEDTTPITLADISPAICRGVFTQDHIFHTSETAHFYVYKKTEGIITHYMSVMVYHPMMEIEHVCVTDEHRGEGKLLLDKLKKLAKLFGPPITLYGLATTPGSAKLYERNGFTSNTYLIAEGKRRRKKKTKRKSKKSKSKKNKRKQEKFTFVVK